MKIPSALKKYAPLLAKKKTLALIVLLLSVSVAVFAFRNIFFIAMLVAVAAVSKLPEIMWRTINIDMTLFNLVVLAFAYNIPFAWIVALSGFYLGLFINALTVKHFAPEKILIPPLGYVITSLIVIPLGYSVFVTGMVAAAIYMAMMLAVYSMIYGFQLFDSLVYIITTLGFNYILFSNFAPFALAILKL